MGGGGGGGDSGGGGGYSVQWDIPGANVLCTKEVELFKNKFGHGDAFAAEKKIFEEAEKKTQYTPQNITKYL
jgi:hypothetical protein